MDAAAQGGVQGPDRLHRDEQGQRQRLVPHRRRQPGGHAMDRQVLVRPQPPQVRVRPPVRHPRHLPGHRPGDRAPRARRQDPQDVQRREDLLDCAFQAVVGEELSEIWNCTCSLLRPGSMACCRGAHSC